MRTPLWEPLSRRAEINHFNGTIVRAVTVCLATLKVCASTPMVTRMPGVTEAMLNPAGAVTTMDPRFCASPARLVSVNCMLSTRSVPLDASTLDTTPRRESAACVPARARTSLALFVGEVLSSIATSAMAMRISTTLPMRNMFEFFMVVALFHEYPHVSSFLIQLAL